MVLVINQNEVAEMLSMESCVNLMERVLADLAKGEASLQLRTTIPIEDKRFFALMPGYVRSTKTVGAKVITIYPENHSQGKPSHQGTVLVFDAEDGSLRAVVDGIHITAVRTAAASAVATKYLADEHASTLALLGSGVQARTHLEAMLLVRPTIQSVRIWSRNEQHARALCEEMQAIYPVQFDVCSTVSAAVRDADIICTLTASAEPILQRDDVLAGAHINAVGACRPNERELASGLVKDSQFYVDRIESAMHEAGDYLIPSQEGLIDEEHIVGELGELIIGSIPGRQGQSTITVFESLGLAIEDLAVAEFLYQEAVRLNKGVRV